MTFGGPPITPHFARSVGAVGRVMVPYSQQEGAGSLFFAVPQGDMCCPDDSHALPVVAGESDGCSRSCERACLSMNCSYFSHVPSTRRNSSKCLFCEKTFKYYARCKGLVTWKHIRGQPLVPQEDSSLVGCSRSWRFFPAARQGNSTDAETASLSVSSSASRAPEIASTLGRGARLPRDASEDEPHCAERGEERTFRHVCATRIRELDTHLERTRFRRAVHFLFGGNSEYGWGNLLPGIFALHWLCLHAGRYCYITMQDQNIGFVLGYASGQSWDISFGSDHGWYKAALGNATKWGLGNSLWSSADKIRTLATQLRESDAQLVEVSLNSGFPLSKHPLLSTLVNMPRLTPLSLQEAELGVPWWTGTRTIDRCFCRYVSQPRFDGLPAKARQQVQAFLAEQEASPPTAALHLRTMVNHLRNRALERTACSPELERPSPWPWIELACGGLVAPNSTVGGHRRVFVMSDAPRLALHLHNRFPQRVTINPLTTLGAQDGRGLELKAVPFMSQIHWHLEQWQEANLLLLLDFHVASCAEELQASPLTSFLGPIVMRSVCVKRLRRFDGSDDTLCPNWEWVFPRGMYRALSTPNDRSYSRCFEPQLGNSHPCKNATGVACHETFTGAVG